VRKTLAFRQKFNPDVDGYEDTQAENNMTLCLCAAIYQLVPIVVDFRGGFPAIWK
jgi:hypothetical protein